MTEQMDFRKGLFVADFKRLPASAQSEVHDWWDKRARAVGIELQEQGDEPLAEHVWELRRLTHEAEASKKGTTVDGPRYPLWCIDRGVKDGHHRYTGPFTTLAEATARYEGDDTDDWVIRRCRRITAEELGTASSCESLIKEIAERVHSPDVYDWTWASWDSEVVKTLDMKAAQDALTEWAQAHLEFAVYTCEPDDEFKKEA